MLGVAQAEAFISQWEAEQGEPQGGSSSASLPLVKFEGGSHDFGGNPDGPMALRGEEQGMAVSFRWGWAAWDGAVSSAYTVPQTGVGQG